MPTPVLARRDAIPVTLTPRPPERRRTLLALCDAPLLRHDDAIHEAIQLLTRDGHSALPVVDADNRLIGLLTEADALVRLTSRRRSFWSALWADRHDLIEEYRKVTGTTVGEVMQPAPVPVCASAGVAQAADLLMRQGLGALPVVDEGRVIGMVRRSDLLAATTLPPPPSRLMIEAGLVAEMEVRLRREAWIAYPRLLAVHATDGELTLLGIVADEEERSALETMAHSIPGCAAVVNRTFPRSRLRLED